MIKAAIFDIDGTLLDSTFIWRGLGERFLLGLGITPQNELDEILRCLSLTDGAEYLCREYSLPLTPSQVIDSTNRLVEDFYLNKAQPKKGAAEMLSLLSSKQISMGIATAGCANLSLPALERLGLRKYFSIEYSCSDYGGKHEPQIFLSAAQALGALPCETVVFEDSFHAALTAKHAGFIVGAVRDSGEPFQQELRECADIYGENLSALFPLIEKMI